MTEVELRDKVLVTLYETESKHIHFDEFCNNNNIVFSSTEQQARIAKALYDKGYITAIPTDQGPLYIINITSEGVEYVENYKSKQSISNPVEILEPASNKKPKNREWLKTHYQWVVGAVAIPVIILIIQMCTADVN